MAARILSAFEIVRGPGSGISMSSLKMAWGPFSWRCCEAKRVRFGCWRGGFAAAWACSRRIRSGSWRRASWSTRSPVSLQMDRSESDSGVSSEERALCLSWSWSWSWSSSR